MSTPKLIYLLVFTIAFGVGLYSKKYHKALYILLGLMGLGLFTELLVNADRYLFKALNESIIYNIYIHLEYIIYAAFFYYINDNRFLKKVVKISILIFLTILILEYTRTTFSVFKAITYISGGTLTILLSTYTLFLIKPIKNTRFIEHPLFWFCSGFIVFYSGILPFTYMQNYLEEIDKVAFKDTSIYFRKGMNIILYVTIIIGFICSNNMQKYSSH